MEQVVHEASNDKLRTNVRQRMVEGATQVLSRRGLHATAFSEVLAITGTSRGSIYHHFPGGKAELIEAVLDDYAARIDDELQTLYGQAADAVVRGAIAQWRGRLARSDCDAGCPVAAVTLAADSGRLQADCRRAFDTWIATLASALQAGGVPDMQQAIRQATLLVATMEGATVLARALGAIEPFDRAVSELVACSGFEAERLRA